MYSANRANALANYGTQCIFTQLEKARLMSDVGWPEMSCSGISLRAENDWNFRLGVGARDRNGRFQQTGLISTTKQYNIDTNRNNDGGRNCSPARLHQYYLSS